MLMLYTAVDRLPVARVAARVSAAFDGAGLLLSLARRWNLARVNAALVASGRRRRAGEPAPSARASSTARASRRRKAAARAGLTPASASKAQAPHRHRYQGSVLALRCTRPTSRTLMAPSRCCARCGADFPNCATSSPTASIAADSCTTRRRLRPVDDRDRPAPARGQRLPVLPRRWVVERTFAWLDRSRRLAKDFEATIASAAAWVYLAQLRLLSRRLAKP